MLFPYFSDISGRNNWTSFFHVHLSQCFGSPSKLLGKKNLQGVRDHFNSAMENRFLFNITESASVSEKIPNKQPMIPGILPGFSLFTPSWLWGQSNPHSFFFPPFFMMCYSQIWYLLLLIQVLISVCPQLWFFYTFWTLMTHTCPCRYIWPTFVFCVSFENYW